MKVGVTDTGIGMREEELKKLFKIFGGSDTSKKLNDDPNPQGIGLGLTICNKLLNQFPLNFGDSTEDYSKLHVKSVYG
jgi:signal transduction histidine kinase